jgi:sugar phosphate isomerase/epimerase
MLDGLPLWVRSVVAHPDALSDIVPYRALGTRLVLENMDDRKITGRVADEMESLFQKLPDAGFCLDVAHIRSIDPTMDAAHELLDRFRSRLRHVHLSSLDQGRHVPLTDNDEGLFAEVLDRCRDVPWILEALPPERWATQMKATAFVVPGVESAS